MGLRPSPHVTVHMQPMRARKPRLIGDRLKKKRFLILSGRLPTSLRQSSNFFLGSTSTTRSFLCSIFIHHYIYSTYPVRSSIFADLSGLHPAQHFISISRFLHFLADVSKKKTNSPPPLIETISPRNEAQTILDGKPCRHILSRPPLSSFSNPTCSLIRPWCSRPEESESSVTFACESTRHTTQPITHKP